MKVFWARFIAWIAFMVVAPVVFICVRYHVFTSQDLNFRLTGWGIIALIIVAISVASILKEVVSCLPRGSMIRQCIVGYIKISPILFIALIIGAIKDYAEAFEQTLVFVFVCEAIAIPLNPLPKWAQDHGISLVEHTLFSAFKRALVESKRES